MLCKQNNARGLETFNHWLDLDCWFSLNDFTCSCFFFFGRQMDV